MNNPLSWSLTWRITVAIGRDGAIPDALRREARLIHFGKPLQDLLREGRLYWASLVLGVLISVGLCMLVSHWLAFLNAVTFPLQHMLFFLPVMRWRIHRATANPPSQSASTPPDAAATAHQALDSRTSERS